YTLSLHDALPICIESALLVSQTVACRNHNDGDDGERWNHLEPFHHQKTTAGGQAKIEKNQIRRASPGLSHTGKRIHCKTNVVLVSLETHMHTLQHVRIIIDD